MSQPFSICVARKIKQKLRCKFSEVFFGTPFMAVKGFFTAQIADRLLGQSRGSQHMGDTRLYSAGRSYRGGSKAIKRDPLI